jgi:septal ring factor EnvC (AmiA/AmiB activator)
LGTREGIIAGLQSAYNGSRREIKALGGKLAQAVERRRTLVAELETARAQASAAETALAAAERQAEENKAALDQARSEAGRLEETSASLANQRLGLGVALGIVLIAAAWGWMRRPRVVAG